MQQRLCWEQFPIHVLKLIFELHVNTLDNCAAACTCKAWRDAVHSIQVHEMHLHATSASAASHWAAFLRARPASHHLRLTSVFDQVKPGHNSEGKISSLAFSSSFYGLPLSCSSIDATGYFVSVLGQMPTDSPATLMDLKTTMGGQFLPSDGTGL